MIDCIIFSKDRACQLDFLLRSLNRHVDLSDFNIKIIYTYSDNDFENGYKKLIDKKLNAAWVLEKNRNFKEILTDNIKEEFIMFLVDDVSFINNFSTKLNEFEMFSQSNDIFSLSLRLSPSINFCYAYNRSSVIPNLKNNIWDWRIAKGDWGYPASLDGNIFKTKDVIDGIKKTDFSGPNGLEGGLGIFVSNTIKKYLMICFQKQKLVNLPLNKVQTALNNKSMNISTKRLNNEYLLNKRMSFDVLKDIKNNMCHVEIGNLVFEEDK